MMIAVHHGTDSTETVSFDEVRDTVLTLVENALARQQERLTTQLAEHVAIQLAHLEHKTVLH